MLKLDRLPADREHVTTTISPPIRILAIVGVVAAIAAGAFVFLHKSSSSGSSDSAAAAIPAASASPAHAAKMHSAMSTHVVMVKHKVVLSPGLPAAVAHKLQHSRVVVVALFSRGGNGDKAAVAEARTGAKQVHAAFAAINLADERTARVMTKFAGSTTAPPAVLVIKRPGKITNRFDGFADSDVVAQAAANAGAHAK
jgi:hypothetical protein